MRTEAKNTPIECRVCENIVDQFGNFVMCKLLNRFVDWEYWNGKCADDCPLKCEAKMNEEE